MDSLIKLYLILGIGVLIMVIYYISMSIVYYTKSSFTNVIKKDLYSLDQIQKMWASAGCNRPISGFDINILTNSEKPQANLYFNSIKKSKAICKK